VSGERKWSVWYTDEAGRQYLIATFDDRDLAERFRFGWPGYRVEQNVRWLLTQPAGAVHHPAPPPVNAIPEGSGPSWRGTR
jgi:hypothetical protein